MTFRKTHINNGIPLTCEQESEIFYARECTEHKRPSMLTPTPDISLAVSLSLKNPMTEPGITFRTGTIVQMVYGIILWTHITVSDTFRSHSDHCLGTVLNH